MTFAHQYAVSVPDGYSADEVDIAIAINGDSPGARVSTHKVLIHRGPRFGPARLEHEGFERVAGIKDCADHYQSAVWISNDARRELALWARTGIGPESR